jgi:hypothetical protein
MPLQSGRSEETLAQWVRKKGNWVDLLCAHICWRSQ